MIIIDIEYVKLFMNHICVQQQEVKKTEFYNHLVLFSVVWGFFLRETGSSDVSLVYILSTEEVQERKR